MAQYVTLNSNQLTELINAILQGGGSGGVVDDILVNGVSVISNRIANIKTHVILSLSEYNLLSNEEKNNGCIYLVTPNASTDYVFHESQDGTIVIRINQSLNENLCFFCGYSNQTGSDSIPQELTQYVPVDYNGASQNWVNGGTTQSGWGGFYNNRIQLWSQDWSSLVTGTMYGIVDFNQTGQQSFNFSDPHDILQGEFAIYCMGHKFSSFTEV